jgi:lysophospholipase L1-like esterase
MNATAARYAALLAIALAAGLSHAAEGDQVDLQIAGEWQVRATVSGVSATLNVAPPAVVSVVGEKHDRLRLFNAQTAGWVKGDKLNGLQAQECTAKGLLDRASLVVRSGPQPSDAAYQIDKDYAADLDWATFGRTSGGPIGENQPVWVDYRYTPMRIDAVVWTRDGKIELRQGQTHVAAPQAPAIQEGERRLANIFLPGPIDRLTPEHLLPVLEAAYPEPAKPSPSVAEQFLPKTMKKLREGQPLRILAWGDSVTAAGYLPDVEHDRWQAQFVARLQKQFPTAKIELVTEAWGGRNTASYLAEPPGSEHNYQEKVLGAKPDLIVSEFVNDAGLNPEQVEERYAKLLADFQAIGAEWIILTPHYVRPDWMGLSSQRDIDNDPRPYVAGLRTFAQKHSVALADASLRYGRLWRQGIPYHTLMLNGINHPGPEGMTLFADSLMALFP